MLNPNGRYQSHDTTVCFCLNKIFQGCKYTQALVKFFRCAWRFLTVTFSATKQKTKTCCQSSQHSIIIYDQLVYFYTATIINIHTIYCNILKTMKLVYSLYWTCLCWGALTNASLRGWYEGTDNPDHPVLNFTYNVEQEESSPFPRISSSKYEEDKSNDRHLSYKSRKSTTTTSTTSKTDRSLFLARDPSQFVLYEDKAVPLERPQSSLSNETDDYFGWSVVMQGNIAAVGAPYDNTKANESGAVHVYEKNHHKNTWTHKAKLLPAQAKEQDNFGNHLEFVGNDENGNVVLAVGAPARRTQRRGRVFFFIRDSRTGKWTQSKEVLEGLDGNDGYGHHFSYCPTTERLAVGAYSYGIIRQGIVLVYTKQTKNFGWNEQSRFSSGNFFKAIFESFGFYVFLIDNVMAISAAGRDDDPGAGWLFKGIAPYGKAYVFTEDANSAGTWTKQQTIQLPLYRTTPINIFGRGFYFDGEYITVGSPFHKPPFGSAFVYKKNGRGTFDEIQTLPPPGIRTLAMGKFAYRQGNQLFVQSSYAPDRIVLPTDIVTAQACVNVYELNSNSNQDEDDWVYQYSLTQDFNPISREKGGGSFGISISGDGNLLIVGDKRIDEAYIIDLNSVERNKQPDISISEDG